MRPLLICALCATACSGPGGPGKARKPDAVALVDECDPVVRAPTSPVLGEAAEADPHEDRFGAAPDPFHVHLGWPSSDPSRSISWVWRTDVDTLATAVEYGVDGKLDRRAEGGSSLFGGMTSGEGAARVHEVKLCAELEPNTTYSYRVGGEGHWSQTYSFTTPGEPGSFDTFTVGFIGDSRGAYEALDDLLLSMEDHEPDFYVFGGDMVDLGPSLVQWEEWFDATGDLFARKVLVPAHGNHEFLAVHYFALFSLPNNEEWFSVRYGDLHLVSLNDTVNAGENRSVHQVDYMRDVFSKYPSTWKIPVHHQSIYATCTTHGSDLDLRTYWEPVYDEFEVSVVIAGHNHLYERSVPIRAGQQVAPEDGTIYVVTGGAGAPLYRSWDETLWFGDVAEPVEHYVIGEFGPGSATFTARDRAGNVIDAFTVTR